MCGQTRASSFAASSLRRCQLAHAPPRSPRGLFPLLPAEKHASLPVLPPLHIYLHPRLIISPSPRPVHTLPLPLPCSTPASTSVRTLASTDPVPFQATTSPASCPPFLFLPLTAMCTFDDSWSAMDVIPPLLKVLSLLATGYAVHRSLSPPNPPPSPKTRIDNRTLFERAIRHVTFCSKMMTWIVVLADAFVTLYLAFPSPVTRPLAPLASLLLPSAPSSSTSPHPVASEGLASTLASPSLLFLLGAALAIAGGWLRVACFRALGSLFTFELTIHPTHKLITDGPYAHVRHPSYTGVYATLLGSTTIMLAPSAWLHEAWLAPSLCALTRAAAPFFFAIASAPASGASASADSIQVPPTSTSSPSVADRCPQSVAHLGACLAWLFAAFWVTKVTYALRSTNKRVVTEDRELHRVFGEQWEEWAARVRWRLLPWVY
ncbi:hypothetical protein L226DRAFT_251385 [Lentinus tigrinus ALCF2SS1-7]|uniref:uncharacterized protein n=1 Tax=Lentinus tigrinus ALCF2SS1-7 TaxID=1328758 RepID=UPI00116624E7|nr:hypothetical protein L226DRAFT_251385 [Lentinus tigrinus ALCF2SS1-7]